MRRNFYVSVKDGKRFGILLGPYVTHEEAKSNVARAKKLADGADPFACFYGFGTCSLPNDVEITPRFA